MVLRRLPLGLAFCLAVFGCETTAQQVAQDPLLLSKHPVAGGNAAEPSALLARSEPIAPDLPFEAVVSVRQPAARAREEALALARKRNEVPGNAAVPADPATPVAGQPKTPAMKQSPENASVSAYPVKRQLVKGIYGAAIDHSWLQGVVLRIGPEGVQMRYGHPWVAGPKEHQVLILPAKQLQDVRVGDVIRVEGEMATNPKDPYLPIYRLKNVARLSTDS